MSNLKRKMGRPPIAGEAMEQISIRLTKSELSRLDNFVEGSEDSRNEWVRLFLNRGMDTWRGQKSTSPPQKQD